MLLTIIRFLENNKTQSVGTKVKEKRENSSNNNALKKKLDSRQKIPVCYNCNEAGHLSINCSKAQNRPRCVKCNKSGHVEDNCTEHSQKAKGVRNIKTKSDNIVCKNILIHNVETITLVDSGTECSLAQKAFARNFNLEEIPERELKF